MELVIIQNNEKSYNKWRISIFVALLFLIIVNPILYKLVDMVFGKLFRVANSQGCPTYPGFLLHALVFFLLLRVSMNVENSKLTNLEKWRYSFYTLLIFLFVANPLTYKLTDDIFGKVFKVANSNGCATSSGMVLHSLVFLFILRFAMDLE